MGYCTIDEVKRITGIKPTHFGFEKTDTIGLDNLINQWIEQATTIIDEYCNRTFETIPGGVGIACVQIVANIITNAEARKNSPLVKVNDWTVRTVPSEIFTTPIKELLTPYTKADEIHDNAMIDILTITGGNDENNY
ncbi:hypothetical protein [Methanosphaera sp.]|jgi:hypothetical protein|uniref:hypothetical protein n=1 Tax=Methanosphaera sp. TaxID=2666342 RepID=UPI003D923B43